MKNFIFCLVALFAFSNVHAAETTIGLDSPDAEKQWMFTDKTGSIQNDELVFDGTKAVSKGFYLPLEWNDTKLSAKFMVEPGPDNQVLACGFIVAAANSQRYYAVHFDRNNAILIRSDENSSWNEIKRIPVPNRESGKWYDASLEIDGDTLTVAFDGKKRFDANDVSFSGPGRIGFYANQGLVHVKDIVVGGKAEVATNEFKIPKPTWIHVCVDAGAGAYEAFPDVCRLQDGRLFCVFYAGYAHIAVPNERFPKGGRISGCYSSDEGKTWTPAETIVDTPLDDRDPSVVQLADGRILCNFFTYEDHDKPAPVATTCVVESGDNGKTWSAPRELFRNAPTSQPIRVLSDETLLMPLYLFEKRHYRGAVSLSRDAGKTWSDVIEIPNAGKPLDAETDVIELKDGSLYAVQRPWMGISRSKDKGKTWSVSEHIGFEGHCPYLLRTSDDVILLATRLPKTNLRISRDECKTWSESILIDDVFGAYPSMVELKDGSILVVYYEEGAGSSIRAKKFRVVESGVEWLPFE